MQTESRRSGGNFAGFTIDESATEELTTGELTTEELMLAERPVTCWLTMCPSPAPWQRWQVIPPCRNGLPENLLSVPATGACSPLVWQFRQSTYAGRFIGLSRASV